MVAYGGGQLFDDDNIAARATGRQRAVCRRGRGRRGGEVTVMAFVPGAACADQPTAVSGVEAAYEKFSTTMSRVISKAGEVVFANPRRPATEGLKERWNFP